MRDASVEPTITNFSLTGYNTLLVVVAGLASAAFLYFGTWAASDLVVALGRARSSARDCAATSRQRCFFIRFSRVDPRRNESMELRQA